MMYNVNIDLREGATFMRARYGLRLWLTIFAAFVAALAPVAVAALCVNHDCAGEECAYCEALRLAARADGACACAQCAFSSDIGECARLTSAARASVSAATPITLRVRLNN